VAGERRTEKATPKRRQEARKRGQIARSSEIPSTLVLISSLFLLRFLGPDMVDRIRELMGLALNISDPGCGMGYLIRSAYQAFLLSVIPIFSVVVVVALASNLVQTGFLLTPFPLKPDLRRLNPLLGAKRLVSLRSWVELVKAFLKIALVGYVSYSVIKGGYERILQLGSEGPYGIMGSIGEIGFGISIRVSALFLALSFLDYLFQRREHEKSIMMTKEEVREEIKEMEGDPLLRSRIRRRQRQVAYARMMQHVPRSDVVVTNPVHVAVALLYLPGEMSAPRVVAKGARLMAERIKEIARANGVPIVQNPPLAQALYRDVDVGEEIPPSLYKAVAEILAFVYRLKGRI
jgi:flagellar biosynthetic protein FlhB